MTTRREPLSRPRFSARPGIPETTCDGLIPGEDVAIAPILVHVVADDKGTVRSHVNLTEPVPAGEVLIFGRASGTIHVIRVGL